MANVTITELPAAGAITGTESVPIVQNGVTVQTTTAALAGSPVQTQTFLTLNQEPTLNNSRALSNGTGVGLVDGGAQSTLSITLNAASGSLEAASNGMIAKTASNAVAARTMSSTTTGLSVTNGDGVAGNPTFALTGVALAVAGATGTGALALTSSTTVSTRTILGTSSQIDVTDGNFANSPVIAISADPVLSGNGGLVVPVGTTGQRGSSVNGNLRYNSTTATFEGYANNAWGAITTGLGVTSVGTGTGLTGGPITSTGTISLADTAVVPASYTYASITVDQQGRITAASNGSVTTGTVTSVAQSFTGGLIAVSGSPITSTGTLALTVAGTSGGVPYFSSGTTWASSGALTANAIVLGGGAGAAPAPLASLGTTTTVLHGNAAGAPTFGAVSLTADVTGTLPIANGGTGATTSAGAAFALKGANIDLTSVALTTGTVSTTPSGSTDIANKSYVDTVAQGLDTKASCLAATTVNITLSAPQTIDGIALVAGDRCLVKNQSTAADNGIYLVAAGSWTRALDMDTWAEVPGAYVFIQTGTTQADTGWVCTSNAGGTIGVTAITWAQFSGAGSGVSSLNFGTTGLTPASVTTGAITVAGTLAVANGGTNATTASITSFNNITGYTAAGATGTTSTNLVFSASPTFTGTLGAAAITASTTLGVTGTSTLSGNAIVSVTDNTNAALRITQLGTGNALLVEDSTNPDATPFVINRFGNVSVGALTSTPSYFSEPAINVMATESTESKPEAVVASYNATSAYGGMLTLSRSKSGTAGTAGSILASGDAIGRLGFNGDDGVGLRITAASIGAFVDGTPGTNDMPGRLVFATTADGASSPTERMRINSAGTVSLASTTEQTGTTGAMTVAGGVYVAKILTAIGGISGGTF